MPETLLLSREEAAELLNIGVTTLWRLTKRGQIHSVKIGSRCLYPRTALLSFVLVISGQTGEAEQV